MKFDKTKVYTAVNADEVKAGSKGVFADTYAALQRIISEEVVGSYVKELFAVEPADYQKRFCVKSADSTFSHNSLFYLVEEPEEKQYRPYKSTDEMFKDFYFRFNVYCADYELPCIWVKSKNSLIKHCITTVDDTAVYLSGTAYRIESLFKNYTYLDGTPCGIKEE